MYYNIALINVMQYFVALVYEKKKPHTQGREHKLIHTHNISIPYVRRTK